MRRIIATALEAAGLAAVAGCVAMVCLPAGIGVLGVGLVLFGVAIERTLS